MLAIEYKPEEKKSQSRMPITLGNKQRKGSNSEKNNEVKA